MCCCVEKDEDKFFKNAWSKLWQQTNKSVPFCKDCINSRFEEMKSRYKSDLLALQLCLYPMDIPFYAEIYQSIVENNSIFSVGLYLRQMQMRQFQYKTYINTIVENQENRTATEVRESVETKWKKEDKQNMYYAISVVGYDPFDDSGLSDSDRKFLFNNLAGYCDDDSVKKDNHKIQCIIQITQAQLQCNKIDGFINSELLNIPVDDKKIKDLTTTKKTLLDSIAKIAQDNNLSSNYNDNSRKGKDTFSEKMKEIAEDDFEAIKVNLFDIKTCEAMKQIADLSNRSIIDQLGLDANEYTDIIKDQRELVQKFESERDCLLEENRMLKNKIEDLTAKKRR